MAYSAAIRAVSSGVGLSKSTQKGFVLSELVASLATVVWIVSIRPAQIAKRGIGIDTDTKAGHSQLPRIRSDAPARLIVPPVSTRSSPWSPTASWHPNGRLLEPIGRGRTAQKQ